MRSISLSSVVLSLCLLWGCSDQSAPIPTIELTDLRGGSVNIDPSRHPLTVIYFLSPECPLCINYTKEITRLNRSFSSERVRSYGVFPGQWYSVEEIAAFALMYQIGIPLHIDPKNELARALEASVTPEVFVLNQQGKVVYSGAIDNWVNALGKKKLAVSERYLEDAIRATLTGEALKTPKTVPIGCLIE